MRSYPRQAAGFQLLHVEDRLAVAGFRLLPARKPVVWNGFCFGFFPGKNKKLSQMTDLMKLVFKKAEVPCNYRETKTDKTPLQQLIVGNAGLWLSFCLANCGRRRDETIGARERGQQGASSGVARGGCTHVRGQMPVPRGILHSASARGSHATARFIRSTDRCTSFCMCLIEPAEPVRTSLVRTRLVSRERDRCK